LAEASSVVAFAVRLIASAGTSAHRTVGAIEALVAVADLGELIADTVPAAVVGATLLLDLALETDEAHRARTLALVTLATVVLAVRSTRLVGASRSLPPNLAQASRVVAAVAVLAVRADRLRAVDATIADIALALPRNTVTAAVTGASIGAHLLLASLAHIPTGAITHAIHAPSVVGAVARASLERAVESCPPHLTHAVRSNTVSMSRAIVGARST